MTVVFQALLRLAQIPIIGWIEEAYSGRIGEPRSAALLPAGLPEPTCWSRTGVIAGVGSVLVFLPQILLLFLFVGILEDTGYMARVAFLMDRVMKALGSPRARVRADALRLCLRRPRDPRDAHDGAPPRPAPDDAGRPADDLLGAPAGLRAPDRGAWSPIGESGGWFTQGLMLAGMYLFSTLVALAAAAVLGRTVLKGPVAVTRS